jgi:hypothetical protein
MKQLKDYFNDYLEYMNKTYKSRADWYNRCKKDKQFYYSEMEKYAVSNAYLQAVRRHKRIEKVEEMPETTNIEMVEKAKYLWSISCNYKDLLYKDLIEEFLTSESIAYCVDSGLIKHVDEQADRRIIRWTINYNNEIYFDNRLYKEKFQKY